MPKSVVACLVAFLALTERALANIIVIENFNEDSVEKFESNEEESSIFIPCPEYYRLDINLTYTSISTNIKRYFCQFLPVFCFVWKGKMMDC